MPNFQGLLAGAWAGRSGIEKLNCRKSVARMQRNLEEIFGAHTGEFTERLRRSRDRKHR